MLGSSYYHSLFKEKRYPHLDTGLFRIQIRVYDQQVQKAIESIRGNKLDEETKKALIDSIERLQAFVRQERDTQRVIAKYKALSAMLQRTLIEENVSVEEKAQVVDEYLTAFKKPASALENKIETGLIIGVVVLSALAPLAAILATPLIPFSTIFALIGLSAVALYLATAVVTMVVEVSMVLAVSLLIGLCAQSALAPLGKLFQMNGQEYKEAVQLNDELSLYFPTLFDGNESLDVGSNDHSL